MFEPETDAARTARLERLSALIKGEPRALTGKDLGAVLPPRGPSGCAQNRERQRVANMLKRLGYVYIDRGPLRASVNH